MFKYQNQNLQKQFEQSLAGAKSLYLYQLKTAREAADKFAPVVDLIPDDVSWFTGSEKIFIWIKGGRAEFSAAVVRFATLFGEQPDIQVKAGEFTADFKDHFVHVYLTNPDDCKLIEVEETKVVKVLRPHPECVAALKQLENVG